MKIGYARISTSDQTLTPQTDALNDAGCERLFTDIASGAKTQRPGLDKAVEFCRSGDTLVVWKLDRIGISMSHLIEMVQKLEKRDVGLQSLTENIDTTTTGGRLIFYLFGAVAEFERDLIRERVQAGLKSARARGRKGGRPAVPNLRVAGLGIAKSTQYKYAGPVTKNPWSNYSFHGLSNPSTTMWYP